MTLPPMKDRILALGATKTANDPVLIIRDTIRTLATLLQSSEYCWCQSYPCECVMVLFDDLTEVLEARYPQLKTARIADQGETP